MKLFFSENHVDITRKIITLKEVEKNSGREENIKSAIIYFIPTFISNLHFFYYFLIYINLCI